MTIYKVQMDNVCSYIPVNMMLAYSQQGYTIIRVEDVVIPPEEVAAEMEKAIKEQAAGMAAYNAMMGERNESKQ